MAEFAKGRTDWPHKEKLVTMALTQLEHYPTPIKEPRSELPMVNTGKNGLQITCSGTNLLHGSEADRRAF